jgi:hypothetical protein
MNTEAAARHSYLLPISLVTNQPWFGQVAANTSQAGSITMPLLSAGDSLRSISLWRRYHTTWLVRFEPNEFENALGRTLIENALIRTLAGEARATSNCQQVSLRWDQGPSKFLPVRSGRKRSLQDQTTAQLLIERIQSLSGLTLEEISPLVGVSRRSLQNWRAQRQISARKEQRLRDIADVLSLFSFRNATEARRKLLDRVPGNVRPYDLLAEGRFDSAYTMITGLAAIPARMPAQAVRAVPLPPAHSLVARLSNREDGPPFKPERVDLSRSKRLKR